MREKQKPPHVTSHEVLHSFSIPDLRAVLAALGKNWQRVQFSARHMVLRDGADVVTVLAPTALYPCYQVWLRSGEKEVWDEVRVQFPFADVAVLLARVVQVMRQAKEEAGDLLF